MKKVILVGTSHVFQKVGGRGAEEFRQFVKWAAIDHNVAAIAEEASPEALRDTTGEAAKSVCQILSSEMTLHHRFCDPENKERKVAGIVGMQQIQIEGWRHHDGKDGEWAKREIQVSHDKRESIWLKRMQELDAWPMLYVCGANHIRSFRVKLEGAGIIVEVVVEDWDLPAAM
jgi:hypothetical protein